ncbi:MAG: hypothetical protein QXT25_00875 [Candidatus Anstonellaceae archaeon]
MNGSDPSVMLANPICNFTNGTVYGSCDVATTTKGAANCTDGTQCLSLTKTECLKTSSCYWNETQSICQGGLAYKIFPICADPAPSKCINEKCVAMVCGYSKFEVGPTPVASDFDESKKTAPISASGGDALSGRGLFGTSCAFKEMNQRLYNQMRQAKTNLWVNSFRFGVGRSYSDFEQARYFFPVSDRFCSLTGTGGKDRFMNYLNAPSTWCGEYSGIAYHCSKNGLNFSSQQQCQNYCFGLLPPQDCNPISAGQKYRCIDTEFLYDDKKACLNECQILSDPDACSNDSQKFPFLEPDARYRSVLQADYIYGTNTYLSSCNLFSSCDQTYKEACKQENWRAEGSTFNLHHDCADKAPYTCPLDKEGTRECLWSDATEGHRQGMKWKQHRQFSLELDNKYYEKQLGKQISDPQKASDFECESDIDCLSGVCDKTVYKRTSCKDVMGPGLIDCGCEREGLDRINCGYVEDGFAGSGTFYVVNTFNKSINEFGFELSKSNLVLDGRINPQKGAIYVITQKYASSRPALPNESNKFLKNCNVKPLRTDLLFSQAQIQQAALDPSVFVQVEMCMIDTSGVIKLYSKNSPSIKIPSTDSPLCTQETYNAAGQKVQKEGWRVYVSAYHLDFTTVNGQGAIGRCKLTDVPQAATAPYLELRTLGWCAPCTYATLAVQKITFGMSPWKYNCYSFRAYYNYTASDGGIPTMMADGRSTRNNAYDINPVSRDFVVEGKIRNDQDGWLGRGFYDQRVDGHTAEYICTDGWGRNWFDPERNVEFRFSSSEHGWHTPLMMEPSLPFVVQKTRDYLAAGVMPILDISEGGPYLSAVEWHMMIIEGLLKTKYGPEIKFSQTKKIPYIDGAVIYAIANLTHIKNESLRGSIWSMDGAYNMELAEYLNIKKTSNNERIYLNGGKNLTIYTAVYFKKTSKNPPLIAIDVGDPEGREADVYSTLDDFFYKPGERGREWRIANAVPDEYPGYVDLLLQEWVPKCNKGGVSDEEKIEREFNYRMNISRNFLKNYSRPSIIWRFHFERNTNCNIDKFLSYLFDHQADMVDAGVIGLIYDAWLTKDGRIYVDYNKPNWDKGVKTGTTDIISANELTLERLGMQSKTDVFCSLQNHSRKILGINKMTYGQKVYAENKTCICEPCSQADIASGYCMPNVNYQPGDEDLPQLYCLDSKKCSMPDPTWTNYSYYRCPAMCVNFSACTRCSQMPAPQPGQSNLFCRIETSMGEIFQALKNYSDISDDYWDILASVPNKDKCCLNTSDARTGSEIRYTYSKIEAIKQRNELIQYPRRGEVGVDCGRVPDTSVLQYCNVKIPITNNHLFCSRIS